MDGNLAGFTVRVQHLDRLEFKLHTLIGNGNRLIVRCGERELAERFAVQHNRPLDRAVVTCFGGRTSLLNAVSFNLQAVGYGRGHCQAECVCSRKLNLIAKCCGNLHHVFFDIGQRANDHKCAPWPSGNRLRNADGPRDERKRRGQSRACGRFRLESFGCQLRGRSCQGRLEFCRVGLNLKRFRCYHGNQPLLACNIQWLQQR